MKREIHIELKEIDMPKSVGGVTIRSDYTPNDYCVILNSTKDDRRKALAFLHEMLHVFHNDFEAVARPVAEIEAERRAELLELLQLAIEEGA